MGDRIRITSADAARDLASFCSRARRVLDGQARLIATGGFLQCYVGILMPRGLLDLTPTVLGARVVAVEEGASLDAVVPLESFVHRIEQAVASASEGPVDVELPHSAPTLQWPSITPPRDGWRRRLSVSTALLADVAAKGVTAVADALPDNPGEALVQRIRAEVWGQSLPHRKAIPWGAGFAAESLGLLDGRSLSVHSQGTWVRLTSPQGYILVKATGPLEGLGEPDPDED